METGGRLFAGKRVGEGVHQGRPYGGRVRWRKGGGQVSNLPLGSCRTRRRRATTRVAPTEGGMGSCIREDTGRGGRFPNRRYVGVAEHDVDGQPQGLSLRRRHVGRDVDRGEEGRFAYPPLRLVGSWIVWRERAGFEPAPTEKGLVVGGVVKMDSRPRLHGGRHSARIMRVGGVRGRRWVPACARTRRYSFRLVLIIDWVSLCAWDDSF